MQFFLKNRESNFAKARKKLFVEKYCSLTKFTGNI